MKALDIAKYMINKCLTEEKPISNLQLQKMLYFAQAKWYSLGYGDLFTEDICAWKFGPVIPDVYYEYSIYAGTPVYEKYEISLDLDDNKMSILNRLIEEKREQPIWTLVEETHKDGSPWDTVYNEQGSRQVINRDMMEKYFRDRADDIC